jgi:hypothetical protein
MVLDLSDEQSAAFENELRRIIDEDRYPFSRIAWNSASTGKLRRSASERSVVPSDLVR